MIPSCPGCHAGSASVVRDGHFIRRCDSRKIQRFRCKHCQRGFSRSTDSRRYRQKQRRINALIQPLLCSGLSQRRLAVLLGISRTTLVRRIRWLAQQARERHWRALIKRVASTGPFANLQFDDLHTFEHSKCKPTSVCVVVDADNRFILGHSVAQIPASGPLAAVSRKKYGYRADHSVQARHDLFGRLSDYIARDVRIASDEHNRYPALIRANLPNAVHSQHKSIRGCVTGQGELKKTQFDPLFCVNHTLAMLRANINRLVRRTWCTTKRNERLDDHLALYIDYHNRELLKQTSC